MIRFVFALFFVFLIAALLQASFSYASPSSCSDATAARLQNCLDQVERDESVLPGGPCSSFDWRCICTKQQGLADCFAVCPSQIPQDTANFDKMNCAGQHDGITMNDLGGDLMYTWSDLNIALGGMPDGNIQFPPDQSQSTSATPPLASSNSANQSTSTAVGKDDTKPASNTTVVSVPSTNSSFKQATGFLSLLGLFAFLNIMLIINFI